MITIIPNWHPILVHFTIGLLATSVLFYFASSLISSNHEWKQQWRHTANWCLWTGCIFVVLTVIAGWYAYNSVAHDAASHQAMTLHRNWAVPTAILFLIIGFSAMRLATTKKVPDTLFLSSSFIAAILLMVTGWLGGEAVYRHGLGVMSLPVVENGADSHDHVHHDQTINEIDHHTDEEADNHAEPEPVIEHLDDGHHH